MFVVFSTRNYNKIVDKVFYTIYILRFVNSQFPALNIY